MDKIDKNNISINNIDIVLFLENCYKNNLKIDIGHLNILISLLNSENYISGEYLKKIINRDSRGAVHNRINDLKQIGFNIKSKPGTFGGYYIESIPPWFKLKK